MVQHFIGRYSRYSRYQTALPKLQEIICAAYRVVRTTLAARRELQSNSPKFRYMWCEQHLPHAENCKAILQSSDICGANNTCRTPRIAKHKLHFHVSENFTYYNPKKSVTHYTLQARCVKKGQRNFTFSILFRRGELRSPAGVHRTPLRR